MKAIILAAGYAHRLYPMTLNFPKALLEVAGRPILDRILDEIDRVDSITEVVIVSNHRFIRHFDEWARTRVLPNQKPVVLLDDGTETEADRLGAIGDMHFAIKELNIDEDVLVVAGDNLFTYDLTEIVEAYQQHGEDMLLGQTLETVEDPRRFAIAVIDDEGALIDLQEKPEEPKSNIAIYASYFYRKDTLPLITQYLEEGNNPDSPGYFPVWLYKRKTVRVHLFDGKCYDIGTHESYARIQEIFSEIDLDGAKLP